MARSFRTSWHADWTTDLDPSVLQPDSHDVTVMRARMRLSPGGSPAEYEATVRMSCTHDAQTSHLVTIRSATQCQLRWTLTHPTTHCPGCGQADHTPSRWNRRTYVVA